MSPACLQTTRSAARFARKKQEIFYIFSALTAATNAVRLANSVQSNPVNSRRNSVALRLITPSRTGGHVKPPASSRLAIKHRPEPSHIRILIRSARFDRNMNISPVYGSNVSVCVTRDASPSMPRRKSTGWVATMIRNPGRVGRPRIITLDQAWSARDATLASPRNPAPAPAPAPPQSQSTPQDHLRSRPVPDQPQPHRASSLAVIQQGSWKGRVAQNAPQP